MTRAALVRRTVLNSICDDGENIDQIILQDINTEVAKYGITIPRADVVSALAELVGDGMAQAYVLGPAGDFLQEYPGMPAVDTIEGPLFRTYFFITEKGKRAHASEPYPFDEAGDLQPGWQLDAEDEPQTG